MGGRCNSLAARGAADCQIGKQDGRRRCKWVLVVAAEQPQTGWDCSSSCDRCGECIPAGAGAFVRSEQRICRASGDARERARLHAVAAPWLVLLLLADRANACKGGGADNGKSAGEHCTWRRQAGGQIQTHGRLGRTLADCCAPLTCPF